MKRLVVCLLLTLTLSGMLWAPDNLPPGSQPTRPEITEPLLGARPPSILRYLDLKVVTFIKITRQANGLVTNPADPSVEVSDSAVIAGILKMLDQIPATGTVQKKMPADADRRILTFRDKDGTTAHIYFVKDRLRAPITTNGEYYDDKETVKVEKQLLNKVNDLLKKAK